MIDSRKIQDLHPLVQVRAIEFKARAEMKLGIELIVTSTLRDSECQESLYAIGRTKPGKCVTNARGGDSYHNWAVALDIVPKRNGKLIWDDEDEIWQQLGEIGEECGLEWAGRWKSFKELCHFQYTQGLTIADFKAGKHLDHAIA